MMQNMIRARAPLRLGLAGGGTDVSPFCDRYGGNVLNATIDRYAYAILEQTDERRCRFEAADQNSADELMLDADLSERGVLPLHRAVYRRIVEQFHGGHRIPVHMVTFCDAPVGSGLGSSSTLVVAMVQAYSEWLNLGLDDYQVADLAFQIERVDCGFQGGRQDQYSAAFGGFNFMEFYDHNRALINPLRIQDRVRCELEASLLLFYTGVSRKSAEIIEAQSRNLDSGSEAALEAMHGLKREAHSMKECLLKGDFDGLVRSMRLGWESKKRSASAVSTAEIDRIYERALAAGALAGKVSGAGGGGFMMFFVTPARRMAVIEALRQCGGEVSNCHFTDHGAQAWRA